MLVRPNIRQRKNKACLRSLLLKTRVLHCSNDVKLSTATLIQQGVLEPRHLDLRPFILQAKILMSPIRWLTRCGDEKRLLGRFNFVQGVVVKTLGSLKRRGNNYVSRVRRTAYIGAPDIWNALKTPLVWLVYTRFNVRLPKTSKCPWYNLIDNTQCEENLLRQRYTVKRTNVTWVNFLLADDTNSTPCCTSLKWFEKTSNHTRRPF